MRKTLIIAMFLGGCQSAHAGMFITEFMYSGYADSTTKASEFIEFTNVGSTAVNMTGWSFDDNTETPGSLDLSVFGLVQPGESVLITEGAVADFRTAWGLSNSVKIIGGNTNNLGRSDEMNLYDSASHLVDSLTFNDEGSGTVKGPRARYFSANVPNRAALGTNNYSKWVLSSVGDSFGSWKSAKVGSSYDVASPGRFIVPEPATAAFLVLGGLSMFVVRRKTA